MVRLREQLTSVFERTRSVQRRFSEIGGSGLASAITLRSFLALFPLAVLAIAVLGFASLNVEDLSSRIVEELGVAGRGAETVTDAVDAAQRSRRAATVVGVAGLVWSGLGLMIGFQLAFNAAWRVPGRGLRDRVIGTGWLLGAGTLALVSLGGVAAAQAWLPGGLAFLSYVLAAGIDFCILWWTSKLLPNREIPWAALAGPAGAAAVVVGILKFAGTSVMPELVADSSALYGSLGVVFALLVWLLLFGRVVVYMAVVQVLGWERRHHGELPPSRPGVDPRPPVRIVDDR